MKTYFISILFIILSTSVFAQEEVIDLSGTWQGVVTQPNDITALTDNYAFWVHIEQEGNNIMGYNRVEIPQSPNFAIYSIAGKIKGNKLNYTQMKITNQSIEHGYWCLSNYYLTYYESENQLKGTWESDMSGCTTGEVILYRTESDFNSETSQPNEYSTIEEIEKDIKNNETITDKKIVMENVFFEYNKSTLKPESEKTLNTVYDFLTNNPKVKIKVTGHTDNKGENEYNLKLSIARAKAVANYLIDKGIDKSRVKYEGYGEAKPIVLNNNDENRQKNRRVEFEILEQ